MLLWTDDAYMVADIEAEKSRPQAAFAVVDIWAISEWIPA
jgi:hypothetical protein